MVVLGLMSAGCSPQPALCEPAVQVGLAKKAGDCVGVDTGSWLGAQATCARTLTSCSTQDQQLLTTAVDCLGRVSTCWSATREVFEAAQQACLGSLVSLSARCADAFGTTGLRVRPDVGLDAGVDAGMPDAGPQPVDDGGAALVLVGVADETRLAFAWSQRQTGEVATLALIATADGGREPERSLAAARIDTTLEAGATLANRFMLVGYTAQGALAYGWVDAGLSAVDAGTAQCAHPNDCPDNKVCDLGQCKTQACRAGTTNTCPAQYKCAGTNTCVRTSFDGSAFDAGVVASGVVTRALPFVSNEVRLAVGPPAFTGDVPVGGFAARRPEVLGIDTARVLVTVEQEGQPFAHGSSVHGADLADDARTTAAVDTVGTRLRTTYNPTSRLTFACYTVGRGVRVQISTDFGRSWGQRATTIEADDNTDGGNSVVTDCDLAPWREGGAMLVTVDDGALQTRLISPMLVVDAPVTAFATSATYTAASHPAIATLPSEHLVHITFTATRQLAGGTSDTEPLAVYRDGTLGAFTQPRGLIVPTANPQDFTSVAIDPATKRALAAFTSVDATASGTPISTVYASMWNPTLRQWGSGSDLSVFAVQQNTTLLFPSKAPSDLWYAFSPSVVALPSGRLGITFVAGPNAGSSGDYRQYYVPFDFDAVSPLATGKGWFSLADAGTVIKPAVRVSQVRVLDPRGSASVPQPSVSSAAADSQITIYGAFIEGTGPAGDVEGRAIFFSRP